MMTVIEAAGLTVSDKTTMNTGPGTMYLTARHRGGRPEVKTYNAVFGSGRSYRRKRRYFARDQTSGPTRMGMLQSFQAGAVLYVCSLVRSDVAHAKGRGDGNR